MEAIMDAREWQKHTLRGYIGGNLRKRLDGERVHHAVREQGNVMTDLPAEG